MRSINENDFDTMVNANKKEGITTILSDIQQTITKIYKSENNNIYTTDAIVEKISDVRYARQHT